MKTKYRALRIIANIYQFFGLVIPMLSVVAGVLAATGRNGGGTAVAVIVSGLITGLFVYGFGQLIIVLLDIEENTRRTSLLLERRRKEQ